MALEKKNIRIVHDGTDYEMWADDIALPDLGATTRDAMGQSKDPFAIAMTTTATTTGMVVTGQITDLLGVAIAGVKKVDVFLHTGDFTPLGTTVNANATGEILRNTATASIQEFITDATGALSVDLDLGATADNCAAEIFCGTVTGHADAISIP